MMESPVVEKSLFSVFLPSIKVIHNPTAVSTAGILNKSPIPKEAESILYAYSLRDSNSDSSEPDKPISFNKDSSRLRVELYAVLETISPSTIERVKVIDATRN